jgi:hypothetical protein
MDFIKNLSIIKIFFISFIYCTVAALLIQCVALPLIFPQLHAGDGLLLGTDSVTFHRIAVEKTEQIREEGLSAWQLRPSGHSPAGIASLLYTILHIRKPVVLVPLNAAIHAASVVLLVLIMRKTFLKETDKAFLCALPFLLFPSALAWYSQIHKDGFFILGFYMALYGLLLLFLNKDNGFVSVKHIVPFAFLVSGGISIWIARPYGVTLLLAVVLIIWVIFLVYFSVKKKFTYIIAGTIVVFAASLVLYPLSEEKGGGGVAVEGLVSEPNVGMEKEAGREEPQKIVLKETWNKSRLIPSFIDSKLYTIANARYRYFLIYPDAGSTIDKDVRFHSAGDIFAYLPRALQISLFAPFPYQWFERGAKSGGTIMRRIVGSEMALSYVALIGLPFAVVFRRKRIELWVTLLFSLSLMLVYSLTIPNIGALHRMRYGFYMIVLAVSVGGWIMVIERIKHKKR